MADEITYIPYGLDEISQQDLMTSLADGLPDFMNLYKWLKKPNNRKAFLEIYSNIVKGLVGASDSSGLWEINSTYDTSNLSPLGKEMAGHAAHYIQLKMALMPLRKKEEEKKKEDLTPFDFKSSFGKQLLNLYGGDRDIFMNPEQGWDSLDTRDVNGFRGTKERKAKMAELLELYKQELANDKDYNFEGTSFKDKQDALTKLLKAIDALRNTPNDESDDLPAFSALGLNYRSFFSNGGNDELTLDDGRKTTYLEYYKELLRKKEEEAKAKEASVKQQQAKWNLGYRFFNFDKFNGRPLTLEESNLNYLNNLVAKDTWTNDEVSQIKLAFNLALKNGALVPLSAEERATFGPMWNNRIQHLRKINGINGIYYDTMSGKYLKPMKAPLLVSFLDILNLNSPEAIAKKEANSDLKLREQYAKRTEMTPQDWEYVASIVPDIASIPDTEPISAAALAFTGAGMRHHALANRPGGMSASDKWWLAADYLGAGLAAIPGFGDAYLVGRILNTTRKFATGLFAAAGAYGLGSATVNAFGKWAKGENMTLQEKMDVVMAIPSLVSAYRLRSREGLNDAAKAANLNNITTNKGKVKVTITDESGNKSVKEITGLSEQKSKELLKQFKNAGNDNSKKTQILKSDSEVQTKASEQGIDLNRVSIETDSRHMASYRKPTEIEFYSETSPSSARTRYNQEIENLKNSGHNWQARRLLIYDKFYKGTGGAKKESEGNWFKKAWHYVTDTPNLELANRIKNGETPKTNSTETPKTTGKRTWSEIEKGPKKWSQSTEAKEYREMLKGNYSNNAILGGTHKIGGITFDVEVPRPGATNGFVEVTFKNGNKETIRFDTQKQLLERISKIIKDNRVLTTTSGKTKVDAKEMGKILKSLKARGLLKHGGKVDSSLDKIIEDFIKNNNI